MRLAVAGLLILLFWGCRKVYEAPVPYQFVNQPGSGRFTQSVRQTMEGVFSVSNGADRFGAQVATKWSYEVEGTDTLYFLSVFTGQETIFINMEGKVQADTLVMNGFWRRLASNETGLVNLELRVRRNGSLQRYTENLSEGDTLVLDGLYGNSGTQAPDRRLTFTYSRPLNRRPFGIMAHRSGGRTSDLLPASENSVEIIKYASRLGATGIEIDVRFTKDGVPILYHDNTLNLRLIQKNGLTGAIEDYTYQQLSTLVRLVNGEKIPTLEQALETVVNNTPLNFVWLDTKYVGSMVPVQNLQHKYQQKAQSLGRNLRIVIGLPSTEAVDAYQKLEDKTQTPILCELDTAITRGLNARIWAPRWTLGAQTGEVDAMKAEGRTVFVWTLDEPKFIQEFINQTAFDGILSNYPTVVAYYHYVSQ